MIANRGLVAAHVVREVGRDSRPGIGFLSEACT